MPLRALHSLSLLLLTGTAVAADWSMCPLPETASLAPAPAASQAEAAGVPASTRLTAERAELVKNGVSELQGGVLIERGSRRLRTERALYDDRDATATIPGALEYRDAGVALRAGGAELGLEADSARFRDSEFRLFEEHARGSAGLLVRTPDNQTLMEDVRYTTCPPGENDWLLDAGELRLNHDEGLGYGRNVLVRFMYLPLFYTPWISFPIDDRRRTGLLAPMVGNTALSGYEFGLPFYWNMAPNYDATLTPRWMSERGTQLQTEFRYLTGTSNGRLYTEYLADDRQFGASRYRYDWTHASSLPADFRLSARVSGVSDDRYFEDFGESLTVISTTVQQPRMLSLSRSGDWYRFNTQFLDYQSLVPGTEPYAKLPAVSFEATHYDLLDGLTLKLDTELVDFRRDGSIEGLRADLLPRAELRFGSPGWFVTPGLGYRHTEYRLEWPDGSALELSRGLPLYSLDAGLTLERDAGKGLLQTLEPRLFYLRVPFEDQAQIPRFDTSEPDLSFSQLFSTNRFIGPDRQGDADQLSLALSSRLLDTASGRELLGAGLGRIRYFEPRRVQLSPTAPPDTADWSGYIAELRFQPDEQWSLTSSVEWDPDTRRTQRASHQLQFRPGDYSVYNLGYRLRGEDFEQADLSFAWPVTDRLSLVGRWYYSLAEDQPLEYFGGFEYESCCWIARLVSRKYVYNRQGDTTDTLLLQIELKGLGAVGRKADEFLEDGILGYGPDDYDY